MLDSLQTIFNIAILAAVVGGGGFVAYRRRHRGTTSPNTSVLLAYYTEGAELVPIGTGEIAGMPYAAITALNQPMILFRVDLDFTSRVHLLGVPKNTDVAQLDPGGRGSTMERVELEGDYSNYFGLFCEKGQQEQARYVLDPKAMVFTIDFCRSHNWEIIDNQLYFLQAASDHPADPTPMMDDIAKFVANIKPVVAVPPSAAELRASTPYGEELRTKLSCPICQVGMPNTSSLFVCPYGHGVLLNAAKLYRLSSGKIAAPKIEHPQEPVARSALSCPSCQHKMTKVPYNGGQPTIDSCMICNYRWLDATDVPLIIKP